MKPSVPKNVLLSIDARRYGIHSQSMRSTYRYNNRIMKNLVASPNWSFKRVMKVRSNKGIAFDCHDKLYTENQRNCFALRGSKGKPTLIYSIDTHTHPGRWRYETYLTILRAGMSNPNPPRCDLRILLTSTSFLEVREENTGKLIDMIALSSADSPGVKFNGMRHDLNLDQVVVSSTKPEGGDVLRYFVVLETCPVVRRALRVPIRKEVFGQNISDVDLSDGILRVLYRKEVVKIFDFNLICRTNRIVDGANDRILHIENLGPPLLVINGSDLMLEINGFPYHYIACSRRRNEYTVRTMDHRTLATFPIGENDLMAFHPDDSGVIAHTNRDSITLYKLVADGKPGSEYLKELNAVKIIRSNRSNNRDMAQPHGHTVTERRSQRATRRPPPPELDENEVILFSDEFEDELQTYLLIGNDHEDPKGRGVVQFFDNPSGAHIRTINFSKKLSMNTSYLVQFDLDVLVVISAKCGGTAEEAHVYRLLHREAWGDECPNRLYEPPGCQSRLRVDTDRDFVPR